MKKNKYAICFGWILCFVAGFIEIYSFAVRGVFAAMQTGNMITLFISLIDKNYNLSLERGIVIIGFIVGLIIAELLKPLFKKSKLSQEFWFIILEIICLIPPICIPVGTNKLSYDLSANIFIALFGAFQLSGFTSLNGNTFISTMMTGVLKNITEHAIKTIKNKDPKEKESTLFYTFMLVFFLLGIVTSYLIIAYTHDTHLTRRLMPLMIIPLLIIEIPISLIAFSKKGDANEKKDD